MCLNNLLALGLRISETDFVAADLKWLLQGVVRVSSDEVLKEELGVSEVAGVILPRLSVASDQSLLEVGGVPDPSFHLLALEEVRSLGDELVSSHLDVLIEEVASEHLLSVLGVEHLGVEVRVSEHGLGDELEVLVMEEHVVVVQEEERDN